MKKSRISLYLFIFPLSMAGILFIISCYTTDIVNNITLSWLQGGMYDAAFFDMV